MSVGNVHRKRWVGTNPAHVSARVSEVSDSGWEGNCWIPPLTAIRRSQTAMKWKHKTLGAHGFSPLSCEQQLQSQRGVFAQRELHGLHSLMASPLQPWLYLPSGKTGATGDATCAHACAARGECHQWGGVNGSPVPWQGVVEQTADPYRKVRAPVIIVFGFLIVLRVRRQLSWGEYFYTDTFYGFALSESELVCQIKYQF